MPEFKETNVRVPYCAFDALAAVMARRGTSRDETVRQLLAEHVSAQEARDPDDRVTHISTVLRYPQPPLGRRAEREDRPVRLRAPAGLLERARAASLRLPGQYQRAHRDYQSRMLTDAVTTAIAVAEPFTDEFLDGLLPVLRHRAALGLWRLTTAESSTKPERILLTEAEGVRADMAWLTNAPLDDEEAAAARHLLLVAEALEEEVGWHSPARFHKSAEIARRMLTGLRAESNEELLYEQGEAWNELYQNALQAADPPPLLRHGGEYDWTGRGGTAVWRAHRRVGLQDFEEWLVDREEDAPAERVMERPGWLLRTPPTWHAHAPAQQNGGQLASPYASWAAEGKILAFPYRNRKAVWPLLRSPGGGWKPVPGIGPLIAAASRLKPEHVTGFIEAVLVDWNHTFEEEPSLDIALLLPADKAHDLGFFTAAQVREARAAARAVTLARMDAVIEAFQDDGLDEHDLEQLREVRGNTRQFRRLARWHDKFIASRFTVERPSWRWTGQSVAGEVLSGSTAALVECLAATAHDRSRLLLEWSMREAWQRAFDQYGRRM